MGTRFTSTALFYVKKHVILLVLFNLSGCSDYAVNLPGGYSLVQVYSGATLISHPKYGVVIEANVDEYIVTGDLVIGHSALAELSPERESSKPGYFVLNTRTNEVRQRMDAKTLESFLKNSGFPGTPKMHKPSRFD